MAKSVITTPLALLFLFTALTSYKCSSLAKTGQLPIDEPHRPGYHFTPPAKWMNDPNGMVYYKGEYHLFYQYYPDSTVWGPMHWGHAVSTDLVHWQHLPIALYPDSLGYIFSGSAVVDEKNTTGFGSASNPAMVAIYTYHNIKAERAGKAEMQSQGIAYSTDKGRTWTKYAGNPVLPTPTGLRDFRDPKVIWHKETQKWIMTLAVGDHVSLYSSPNLKNWSFESDFGKGIGAHGGVWECPDLFPMKVEGTNQTKWVLTVSINPGGPNGGSATQYFVGDFNGNSFALSPEMQTFLSKKQVATIPDGKVFANFNDNSYGPWKVAGDAFGRQPVLGSFNNQNPVTNFEGQGLVNSFLNGDDTQGTLTSPEFTIESSYINFLIGGGNHPHKACANLIINNKIVRTQTGSNAERLDWANWDVTDLKGQKATIQIIDSIKGGWGHILVDQIMFAQMPALPAVNNACWLDYGKDNYAGVSWDGITEKDGRRLILGWMSNWQYAEKVPTKKWRSATTFPRHVQLKTIDNQLQLVSEPVSEIQLLREQKTEQKNVQINDNIELSSYFNFSIAQAELSISFNRPASSNAEEVGIELYNEKSEFIKIGFNFKLKKYFIDRRGCGNNTFSSDFNGLHFSREVAAKDEITLRLLIDKASVELFAQDGSICMTDIFFPTTTLSKGRMFSTKGAVVCTKLTAYKVASINIK